MFDFILSRNRAYAQNLLDLKTEDGKPAPLSTGSTTVSPVASDSLQLK